MAVSRPSSAQSMRSTSPIFQIGQSLAGQGPSYIPVDNSTGIRFSRDTVEPTRTRGQDLYQQQLYRSLVAIRPGMEHLSTRAVGSRRTPIRGVRLKDVIPENVFDRLFPQYRHFQDLERDLSERRINGTRQFNRWISHIERIMTVRRQFRAVFEAAQALVTAHFHNNGLQNYITQNTPEITHWIASHEPSPILFRHEFRFLCALLHFLNHHSYYLLARLVHNIIYLRFEAQSELWSVVHQVIGRIEPPSSDYDLDFDLMVQFETSNHGWTASGWD